MDIPEDHPDGRHRFALRTRTGHPVLPAAWSMVDGALARWFGTSQFGYRQIGALVLPVIVSQAFVTGFSALNPLLVASVGIDAVSAVSTVEYLNILLLCVFVALATAGSVLVAQFAGRGDHASVRRAAGGTLWAVVVPAAVVGVVLLAARGPLLHALLGGAGGPVVGYAEIYLAGSALSYPAYALVEASSAALRGVARTTSALCLTVASNGGFLILAAILVRGLRLGVPGLALALVVARYGAAAFALWLLHRDPAIGSGQRWAWPPDPAMVRRAYVIGAPFVAEQVFFNGGKLVIQLLVVGMGTVPIAVNAVAGALLALTEVIPAAMSVALVPIVGQAIGAGRADDARRLIRSFVWLSSAVLVAGSAVELTCFGWLLNEYDVPAAARHDVLAIFLIGSAARVLGWWAMSFLLPAGLRASGDAVYTTAVASAAMLLRVTFAWLVGVRLGYGVVGIWVVMVIEWGLRSALFAVRFRGSRWERRAYVQA